MNEIQRNRLIYQDSNAYQIGRHDERMEWADKVFDIIDKCYNSAYKDAIDFVCEWIHDNFYEYEIDYDYGSYTELESKFDTKEEMMNHFRKTMEEHLCKRI